MLSIERDKGEQGCITDLKNHVVVLIAMPMDNLVNETGADKYLSRDQSNFSSINADNCIICVLVCLLSHLFQ